MPSQSFQNLDLRMQDIEQLLQAHTALTQFQRARKAAEQAGGELSKIAKIIENLTNQPGRGRRSEVDALNRAAIVLLSAHLQGFIDDLHLECAHIMLVGKVRDIERVAKRAKPRNANPHADIVEKMFDGIGIYEVLGDMRWQKASNTTIRNRLTEYVQVRNKIAHGAQEGVTKAKVIGFQDFVRHFAQNLDEIVAEKIEEATGAKPW